MPQFYFHLSDGVFIPDNKGTSCPTYLDAQKLARKMAEEYGRSGRYVPDDLCICVTDAMGVTVYRIPVVDHSSASEASVNTHTHRIEK